MKKKMFILLGVLGTIMVGVYALSPKALPKECAFCDAEVLARQTIYEDDVAKVLYTHRPIFEGHCLIIPNRHVERFEDLSDKEMTRIGQLTRRVDTAVKRAFGTSSYLLLQKNGVDVGQSVPHVHLHYIPRKAGHSSTLHFLFNMFTVNLFSPLSPAEIQERVCQIQIALVDET